MSNSKININDINIKDDKITQSHIAISIGHTEGTQLDRNECQVLIKCSEAIRLKNALSDIISSSARTHAEMISNLKNALYYLDQYNKSRGDINTKKKKNDKKIINVYKLKIFYNEYKLKDFYNKLDKNIKKIINFHNTIFKLEQQIKKNKDIDLRDQNISVYFYYSGKAANSQYHIGKIKKINIKEKLFFIEFEGNILDRIRYLGNSVKFNFTNLCVIKDTDGDDENRYHRGIFKEPIYNSGCDGELKSIKNV